MIVFRHHRGDLQFAQRREPVVNEALKQVFLLGVSTRQTGRALATLVEEAVSASTVSAVTKAKTVATELM
jgi:transposase-like protein